MMKEKQDTFSSPAGWHALPYSHDPASGSDTQGASKGFYRNTTTTWGNNAIAQEDWNGLGFYLKEYRPDAGKAKVFDYPYDPKVTDPKDALDEAHKFVNASVTQLFYTTNMLHDLFYR
jgi:extracellular elastinolytic metalloproteinase